VIYLDPHTTQKSGSIEDKMNEEEVEMDTTYHCKSASRIPITGMDPSVALVSIIYFYFYLPLKLIKNIFKTMDINIVQNHQ